MRKTGIAQFSRRRLTRPRGPVGVRPCLRRRQAPSGRRRLLVAGLAPDTADAGVGCLGLDAFGRLARDARADRGQPNQQVLGSGAPAGVGVQHLHNEVPELRRAGGRRVVTAGDCHQESGHRVGHERRPPAGALVHHRTQGVDVGRRCRPLPADDLRRHVGQRPDHGPGRGQRGGLVQGRGDPEVQEDRCPRGVDHNVAGLDVPVADALGVGLTKGAADPPDD